MEIKHRNSENRRNLGNWELENDRINKYENGNWKMKS